MNGLEFFCGRTFSCSVLRMSLQTTIYVLIALFRRFWSGWLVKQLTTNETWVVIKSFILWLPQVQREKVQLQVTLLLNLLASSFSPPLFFFFHLCGCFNYSSIKHNLSCLATYAGAVRTGMPRAHDGRSNRALIQIPFHYSGNSWLIPPGD